MVSELGLLHPQKKSEMSSTMPHCFKGIEFRSTRGLLRCRSSERGSGFVLPGDSSMCETSGAGDC
jgi:hypothetical protein